MDAKILPLEQLPQYVLKKLAHTNLGAVLAHGCFDLLHLGHIKHLQAARKFGVQLLVTVTPDEHVNKGPGRPVFTQQQRAEALAALDCVDYVAIGNGMTAADTIRLLKPAVFVKGGEYRHTSGALLAAEMAALKEVGGRLEFTDEVEFHSTTLLNREQPLPAAVHSFLANCSPQLRVSDLLGYLEPAKNWRVLVVGEAIIDRYHFVETLGKSGKEPILAVRRQRSEEYAGGSLAIANHLADFCQHVDVVARFGSSCLLPGGRNRWQDMLASNVTMVPIYQHGAPTIVKERFIEDYPPQKMFEVYDLNEDPDIPAGLALLSVLETLADYDLVIVADYGHGLLDDRAIRTISQRARRFAVNTQANAANHGFNTPFKYPRADYLCLSENELRLALRQRHGDLGQLATAARRRLACNHLMVTCGRRGVAVSWGQAGLLMVPAFTDHFADRVGAGDAVFAVTSLADAAGAPPLGLGVLGNAVGALKVDIVGNSRAVRRAALEQLLLRLGRD